MRRHDDSRLYFRNILDRFILYGSTSRKNLFDAATVNADKIFSVIDKRSPRAYIIKIIQNSMNFGSCDSPANFASPLQNSIVYKDRFPPRRERFFVHYAVDIPFVRKSIRRR